MDTWNLRKPTCSCLIMHTKFSWVGCLSQWDPLSILNLRHQNKINWRHLLHHHTRIPSLLNDGARLAPNNDVQDPKETLSDGAWLNRKKNWCTLNTAKVGVCRTDGTYVCMLSILWVWIILIKSKNTWMVNFQVQKDMELMTCHVAAQKM